MKDEQTLRMFIKRLVACDIDVFGLRKPNLAMDAENDDEDRWFTTENGTHVHIEEGETKKEAMERQFDNPVGEKPSGENSKSAPDHSSNMKELAKAYTETFSAYEDWQDGKISLQEYNKIKADFHKKLNAFSEADKSAFYGISNEELHKLAKEEDAKSADKNSSEEYVTPLGELSPVPNIAMSGNKYIYMLKYHNFPTKENPTGYNADAEYARQGFSQATIPTWEDMKKQGFYDTDPAPDGYFQGAPHIKNAHPGLQPLNGKEIDMPEDAKKEMLSNGGLLFDYRNAMHNNVPFASTFGSASGRAAAYAYTAQSNTLNRILRGVPRDDDMDYADNAALVTQELDKMFSIARTKEPMVVYRGISNLSADEFFGEYKLGAEIQDKGFMSTSINGVKSSGFAGKGYGLFKIRVPAGASALSMRYTEDGKRFSAYPNEDEILLPRNTRYRVVGFEKGEGHLAGFDVIPIVEIIQ